LKHLHTTFNLLFGLVDRFSEEDPTIAVHFSALGEWTAFAAAVGEVDVAVRELLEWAQAGSVPGAAGDGAAGTHPEQEAVDAWPTDVGEALFRAHWLTGAALQLPAALHEIQNLFDACIDAAHASSMTAVDGSEGGTTLSEMCGVVDSLKVGGQMALGRGGG
jgi:hypothetical protein